MSRYIKKDKRCPVCGNVHTYDVLLSYRAEDQYLDGYSDCAELFDRYLECPDCRYLTADMDEEADQKIKDLILDSDVQDRLRKGGRLARFIENAKVREEAGHYRDAADLWQNAGWMAMKDDPKEALACLNRHIDNRVRQIETAEKEITLFDVVSLVDSFRQASRFSEALSAIEDYRRDVMPNLDENDIHNRIIKAEESLIAKGEDRPVKLIEVSDELQ